MVNQRNKNNLTIKLKKIELSLCATTLIIPLQKYYEHGTHERRYKTLVVNVSLLKKIKEKKIDKSVQTNFFLFFSFFD